MTGAQVMKTFMTKFDEVLAAQWRLLTFRPFVTARPESWTPYVIYAVTLTWIAGMGRYWDSPDAELIQTLGLGSLAYLFFMTTLLWAVIAPIAKRRVSYVMVLIFVGMTSAPALLYAIPVETFMTVENAATANYIFLLVVAFWRVALLLDFCKGAAGLSTWGSVTATLLPLTLIMIVLGLFSMEHVTFNFMSGMRPEDLSPSASGGVYSDAIAAFGWSHNTIVLLSWLSWLVFPVLALSYFFFLIRNGAGRPAAAS